VPHCKVEGGPEDDSFGEATSLPTCPRSGTLFYICKQATQMIATTTVPSVCPVIAPSGRSHVTGCVCAAQ
jgi:hypothetical protein